MDDSPTRSGTGVVDRLIEATNAHDLDTLVGCFADDYVLTNPAHPARGFSGSEQVRRNWAGILGGVPDLVCTVVDRAATSADDDLLTSVVWLEVTMTGRRRDGVPHELAGVLVFRVRDDRIVSGRFFLEPVDHSPVDADGAVRSAMGATP